MTNVNPLRRIILAVAAQAAATIVCLLLFILAMNAPPFTTIAILFYRGVAALVVCAVVSGAFLSFVARRRPALCLDAGAIVGAALVAFALNLCVFTLGPVTVDRSISVFMLSRFDAASTPLTLDDISGQFTRVYVSDWRQMERRLAEQTASGNLERVGDGYRLTVQGRAFMQTARLMARVFNTDPRFVGLPEK